MKNEFLIDPLNDIGPLRLGASRNAVLAALGMPEESFHKTPNSPHSTGVWFENGIQNFYEGNRPTVAFIELASAGNVDTILFGLPVFTTPAPILISALEPRAKLDQADPELGYLYIFPALELAFWRPDNDDAEAPYFTTVGIGKTGYVSAQICMQESLFSRDCRARQVCESRHVKDWAGTCHRSIPPINGRRVNKCPPVLACSSCAKRAAGLHRTTA